MYTFFQSVFENHVLKNSNYLSCKFLKSTWIFCPRKGWKSFLCECDQSVISFICHIKLKRLQKWPTESNKCFLLKFSILSWYIIRFTECFVPAGGYWPKQFRPLGKIDMQRSKTYSTASRSYDFSACSREKCLKWALRSKFTKIKWDRLVECRTFTIFKVVLWSNF